MSDVSKFKIIDKIVNVKDNEGREFTNSKFNILDNRINATNGRVDAIVRRCLYLFSGRKLSY